MCRIVYKNIMHTITHPYENTLQADIYLLRLYYEKYTKEIKIYSGDSVRTLG